MTAPSGHSSAWSYVLDQPAKILVVDDDPIFYEFARVHLSTPAASVDAAPNGEVALKLLAHDHFDIVLCISTCRCSTVSSCSQNQIGSTAEQSAGHHADRKGKISCRSPGVQFGRDRLHDQAGQLAQPQLSDPLFSRSKIG